MEDGVVHELRVIALNSSFHLHAVLVPNSNPDATSERVEFDVAA